MNVRYAATLDNGEGFLAFEGGYLAGGRTLPGGHEVWPFPKVRRMVPTDGEFVYLVDETLDMFDPLMVTDLGDGTRLVVTDEPVIGALWGGKVTWYTFDRAAYIEVPV